MRKRILSVLLCAMLVLCLLPVTARAATVVDTIEIKNLVAPVDGNTIFPGANPGSSAYKIYGVDWYNVTDSCFMSVGDQFEAGKIYQAQVWVEANSGYEFKYTDSQTPNVSATVDGISAPVTKAYEYSPWAMVVVTRTFDPCPKKEISHVDIVIDPVVEGGYVPFRISSASANVAVDPSLHTRYYPSGFCWSNTTYNSTVYNGAKFKGGQEYYVDIALKPLYSSYRFTEDFTATVNGKTAKVTRLADNSVVVGYGAACYGTISGSDLNPTATLPKAGNIPDFSVTYAYPQCDHIAYAERPIWTDVATGAKMTSEDTFQAGKEYRLSVTLRADYPYVFERDENDQMRHTPMITGAKVDSYTYGWNSYYARETITLVKTYAVPEEVQEHTHTPSEWRITGAYHFKACTTCGEFLEQEDHLGGTATCKDPGKCTVCGHEYIEANENHAPATTWTACGDLYHAYLCTVCGAHCNPEGHVPGPEATDTEPQKCTVCSYIIAPAKNHTHNLTKVAHAPATCTTAGITEHYTCDGCSVVFADAEGKQPISPDVSLTIPALGHSYTDGKCTVCNHTEGTPEAPTTEPPTEAPTEAPTEKKDDGEPKGDGFTKYLLPILLGLAVFGAALTATLIIVKRKKSPKNN